MAAMVGHVHYSQGTWLWPEPAGLQEQPLDTIVGLSEPQHSWLQSFLKTRVRL